MNFTDLMSRMEEDLTGRKICEQMDVLQEATLQSQAKGTFEKFKSIMEQYQSQTMLKDRSEFKLVMKKIDELGACIDDVKVVIETFNSLRG